MKQVIVVNEALRLPCGKKAAQVTHAAVSYFLTANPDSQRIWLSLGMPKVVLRCESPEQLAKLEAEQRLGHGSSYQSKG